MVNISKFSRLLLTLSLSIGFGVTSLLAMDQDPSELSQSTQSSEDCSEYQFGCASSVKIDSLADGAVRVEQLCELVERDDQSQAEEQNDPSSVNAQLPDGEYGDTSAVLGLHQIERYTSETSTFGGDFGLVRKGGVGVFLVEEGEESEDRSCMPRGGSFSRAQRKVFTYLYQGKVFLKGQQEAARRKVNNLFANCSSADDQTPTDLVLSAYGNVKQRIEAEHLGQIVKQLPPGVNEFSLQMLEGALFQIRPCDDLDRLDHVLRHMKFDKSKPKHGVFRCKSTLEALTLIDEAWGILKCAKAIRAKAKCAKAKCKQIAANGPWSVDVGTHRVTRSDFAPMDGGIPYTVHMGKVVGDLYGSEGARYECLMIRIIVDKVNENWVVTAYPYFDGSENNQAKKDKKNE